MNVMAVNTLLMLHLCFIC